MSIEKLEELARLRERMHQLNQELACERGPDAWLERLRDLVSTGQLQNVGRILACYQEASAYLSAGDMQLLTGYICGHLGLAVELLTELTMEEPNYPLDLVEMPTALSRPDNLYLFFEPPDLDAPTPVSVQTEDSHDDDYDDD